MNKGNGDITLQSKHVLLPNTKIIKIDSDNKLFKRCNNKLENLGALRIGSDDIDEMLEKIQSRDMIDIDFGV